MVYGSSFLISRVVLTSQTNRILECKTVEHSPPSPDCVEESLVMTVFDSMEPIWMAGNWQSSELTTGNYIDKCLKLCLESNKVSNKEFLHTNEYLISNKLCWLLMQVISYVPSLC